jgi:hypothetical protein
MLRNLKATCTILTCLLIAPPVVAQRPTKDRSEVWTFDRIDRIGGIPTTILGHPHVIHTPLGNSVQFNGINDALFIGEHPLAGAEIFTFEAIFRPEQGGAPEQRWFHLAEQDPRTGSDTDTRFLFEIRVIGENWCLDAFVHTPTANVVLLNRQLLHRLDSWYHVAMVYDGTEFRSYVNGVLEGKATVHLEPQGPGHSSVGVRMNKVNYFKGSVRQARFSRRVLAPAAFLKLAGDQSGKMVLGAK